MIGPDKMYMVRHGSYDSRSGGLTEVGRAESERAGQQLLSAGVNHEARLLSSDAPRALQTSHIIAGIIGASVMSSRRINIIGNAPWGVKALDEMLEAALVEANAMPGDGNLVIVTHQPLLDTVAGTQGVQNGQVVEYQPGTWRNPEFSVSEERYLLEELGRSGLSLGLDSN